MKINGHAKDGYYTYGGGGMAWTLNALVNVMRMYDMAHKHIYVLGKSYKQENKMTDEQLKADYKKQQALFIKNAKLKKGSTVTVATSVPSGTSGWADVWEPHMDEYVGKVGTVFYPNDVLGVLVDFADGMRCAFPFFCLMVGGEVADAVSANA